MRGTYTVVLACERPMRVKFGKLGRANVNVGCYLYTGSALGKGAVSLEGRLARHSRPVKKKRWHVDYLSSRRSCRFKGAIYLISNRRLECRVNRAIADSLNTQPSLPRLGASDCKCDAHLVGVAGDLSIGRLLNRLEQIYSKFGPPYRYLGESRLSGLLPISSRRRHGKF
jgi:Uri superfamily endonuclease